MIYAYNEMYLNDAMMNLGELTEYAHDACGFDVDKALGMFVISGYADRFGKGDPMVVCGRSGTELFQDLCYKCGIQREWPKAIVKYSTEEYYWIGYILAYYQWFCNKSFSNIINVIKTKDLLNMYPALHTASEDKAVEVIMDLYNSRQYDSKLIMNKQSGDKKKVNFFTAIITMIAEDILGGADTFDPDPRGLVYMLNNRKIIGASSRRFDGAYPSIYNPKIVWEIKEYYYSKSFGSRVADAVYEPELDGYEFNEIYDRTGQQVYHVMLIDSHYTFWVQGKSYLCRFIDTLNMGLIDELIVGKEVLTRWKEVLEELQ